MVASFINNFHPNLLFKNNDRRKLCALHPSHRRSAQSEALGNKYVVNVVVALSQSYLLETVHFWSNGKILAALFVSSLIMPYRLQNLFSTRCAQRKIVQSNTVKSVNKMFD
jgi:hypothetical protein